MVHLPHLLVLIALSTPLTAASSSLQQQLDLRKHDGEAHTAFAPVRSLTSYEYFRTSCATWDNARTECQDGGGDLAVITTAEHNTEVTAYMQGFSDYSTCNGPYPWLGATDCSGTSCTWVDGSAWSYTGPGFGVDDTNLHFYTNGNWGTWGDGYTAIGICERAFNPSALPVPNPTAQPSFLPAPNPTAQPSSLPVLNPTALPTPAPMAPANPGTCYSQSSTVSVLVGKTLGALQTSKQLAVSEVKPGHRVLGVTADNKNTLAKVLAVNKSPAKSPYLDIKVAGMNNYNKKKTKKISVLQATEFHTVSTCAGEQVPANQLKLGDCLRTVRGHSKIVSITPTPATAQNLTYTLVVEGQTDTIYVGGILTHAKPEHGFGNAHASHAAHTVRAVLVGDVKGKGKPKKGLRGM